MKVSDPDTLEGQKACLSVLKDYCEIALSINSCIEADLPFAYKDLKFGEFAFSYNKQEKRYALVIDNALIIFDPKNYFVSITDPGVIHFTIVETEITNDKFRGEFSKVINNLLNNLKRNFTFEEKDEEVERVLDSLTSFRDSLISDLRQRFVEDPQYKEFLLSELKNKNKRMREALDKFDEELEEGDIDKIIKNSLFIHQK